MSKTTRESIEAELNASETERIELQIRGIINELRELESELRELEAERGLPESQHSKSLPERMTALGMSQPAIDRVRTYSEACFQLGEGGHVNELSDEVKRKLAIIADAELTSAELLADVVAKSSRK